MKRIFTLAIIAMIATLSFAQAPAAVKTAAKKQIQKVMTTQQMQKGQAMKAAYAEKAKAAQETSGSVLRRAASNSQMTAKPVISAVPTPKMRVASKSLTGNHPKTVVKNDAGDIDVECIGYHEEYYDDTQDWYIVLSDDAHNQFIFDIYATEIELGHTYTYVDMEPSYTVAYVDDVESSATAAEFTLTEVDGLKHVEAKMATANGTYNITYTEVPAAVYTYGEWSDFAPKGSTDGTYTFNVMLQSGTAPLSVENVQVRTANEDENVKQVKIPNWGAGFLSNDGVDFIIDWNAETNQCTVAPQATGYTYEGIDVIVSDISVWQGSDYYDSLPCTYDPETATFSLCLAYYVPGVGSFGYSGDSRGNIPETFVMKAETTPDEEPVITDLTAELPYANTFDTEAEQDEAVIYDANGDGKTFTFTNDTKSGSKAARYDYNSKAAGDDYVVFPGLALEAGKSYKVSVDVRSQSSYYTERVEFVAGTVAKASELTIPVIAAVEPGADYETLTADFTPEADGVYYFAAHAISDADCYYLWVDNFSVKENNPNTPQIVTDVTVTPDENAALKAEINFTAPAVNIAGEPIEGNVQVKISRNGEEVKTVAVNAGQESSYVDDNITAPGTYTWSLVAIANELESEAVTAKAYVGEDIPDDVENLEVADLDGKVGITWDAPVDGVNGGIIIPENLTYNVYPVEIVEWFGMVFPDIDYENPYATGLAETQAELDYDTNAGAQQYTYFGVTAENTAGESTGTMAAVLTGAPYELPFVETFPNGSLTYWWGVDYDDNIYDADGGIGITEEGEIEFKAPVAGWIELYSGKIALNGASTPLLKFNTRGDGTLTVTAYGPKKEVTFSAVSASKGAVQLPLITIGNEPWIRVTIHADFEEAGEAYVSNIQVLDNIQKDLEISVAAPSTVVAGKSATVKATVKNLGQSKASNYNVKFYINDNEAASPMFEILPLSFTETAVYEYELETSVFDEAGEVTVKAEVIYDGDVKEVNNADETLVEIVEPSAAPVEEIFAEATTDGIVVNWTVAEASAQEVTEDFESYESCIFADGELCGELTARDLDMGKQYGIEDLNWNYGQMTYAFGVADFEDMGMPTPAASGNQAALFISSYEKQNDDWMISPELPGIAQTISFMALPITTQYGAETFEVLASSTDADVASFTKVESFSSMDNAWTEYSANLPEGTKYFAIRYTSNDIFGLFVDDLKYTVVSATPTAFNIYLDEVLEATVEADKTSYTITDASAGQHEVAVTAVYGENESAPKFAIVDVTTGIQNINANNAEAEIYTVNGVRVQNANKPGVYVINGRKAVVK